MILMHQNTPVAILNDEGTHIKQILNKKHLPVGVCSDNTYTQNILFSSWKKMRAIPHNRQNYQKISRKIGYALGPNFFDYHRASLTDTYWFSQNNTIADNTMIDDWNKINFYDNGFKNDIANISLSNNNNSQPISFISPDLTTDGMLQKGWLLIDSVPVLIKHGNLGPNIDNKHLLCANEVISSYIAKLMNINHVEYKPIVVENNMLCSCPSFIQNTNTDFVNAQQIQYSQNLFGYNFYNYFKNSGYEKQINNMIILDTLLHNNDRHEKNWGFLRDATSLEYISFAPIFDTGSCLGWDNVGKICEFDMKPFDSNRQKQLGLVNYKIDLPEQKEVVQIIESVYNAFQLSEKTFETAIKEIQASYHTINVHNKGTQPSFYTSI